MIADEATENAESMFWKAIEQLKTAGVQRTVAKEEVEVGDESAEKTGSHEKSEDVDSFWPPLDAVEDEVTDEW